MATLLEKLVEVLGDEEIAKKVQSSLGDYMLPKTEYAKVRDALKEKEAELEKIRLSSMDNEQKWQHEMTKAQAIQSEFNVKTNRLEAEKLFVGAGLSQQVYQDILDKSVSEDKDRTLGLVNGFIGILGKEKEIIANQTKENLLNSTKKPETPDNISPKTTTFKTTL